MQPKLPLPSMDIEEYEGDATRVAGVLRALWSLPDGPILNLTELVERAGVIVIPCNFQNRAMDATSLRLNDTPPLIFINSDIPGDRWRFTLAHELGHLILHETPTEEMEDEADAFAAELLLPQDELAPQLRRLTRIRVQDLANLKPYWRVSMAALLMRAKSLGAIKPNSERHLWMQMSKLGYRRVEPNAIPRERVQNYPNLIGYFRSMGYSAEDFAKALRCPLDVLEDLHAEGMNGDRSGGVHLRLVQ
jgi:Zn-dependent peptidase ImmA (M78 family)